MKLNLEINNITESPVESGFFYDVAEKTFDELKYSFLEKKTISISIALVTPEEIKKLNTDYRQKEAVTDVLSFAEFETLEEIKKAAGENEEIFLGELILCYSDIEQYAQNENKEFRKELRTVVSHGILHLLGFDHGKEMFEIQDKIAEEVL